MHCLLITDNPDPVVPFVTGQGCACDIIEPESFDTGRMPPAIGRYSAILLDLDHAGAYEMLGFLCSRLPVIVYSEPDIDKAVGAMKQGAFDYFPKPAARERIMSVLDSLRARFGSGDFFFDDLIGRSRPMQEVFDLIRKAARSESNVLVTGDSGTGKEPVARAIHRWSPRSTKAFMTINCSAIPDTLLESELFGFEKGAFTGANYTKKGILEIADGGTVFFDEIGDVSPLFQTKVLRVLQEGEVMRIGGMHPFRVDVRVIAATNKDLKKGCSRGTFREDLFYRLNVINIHLPPLRERKDDIPILIDHFIRKHASKRKDVRIRGITPDAVAVLSEHSYQGNVRELGNIIERAISFTPGTIIRSEDLPSFLQKNDRKTEKPPHRLKEAVSDLEREIIWTALQNAQGNITRAAQSLGVYRQELQRKIKRLKIAT